MLDRIAELDAAGCELAHPAADPEQVVEAGRLPIAHAHLAHGQPEPRGLELAVAGPAAPEVLGARDVEPDQVARMIGDAHLVGLGIVHPDRVSETVGAVMPASRGW